MGFRPVLFKWDAAEHVMRVVPRFGNVASAQFRDGEEYPLEVREHRSSASHSHYFACVNEAWGNLRGETAEVLRTPGHLRAWALIQAGYFDETLIEAGTGKDGRNRASRMAALARKLDEFAEIKVLRLPAEEPDTWFMRIRTPKSQSRAMMNKEEFEISKRAVLEILAGTIEVTRKTLEQAGKERGGT